ncbi:DUF4177 domain-containing protein [Haladaptatus cibarius]|uniref:DUF4177 domain-containing protein n=1 Tax=Haladaptatus cibarius TaxID=453847 RepID=UPI0006784BAE|nr:DUF4177 domain-containing protein [Haladaptatus cibarius]
MSETEIDRWEYETLRVPRGETKKESEDPKTELNELAVEGWRLVNTIDYTGGGTKYLVFERLVGSSTDNGNEMDEADDANRGELP